MAREHIHRDGAAVGIARPRGVDEGAREEGAVGFRGGRVPGPVVEVRVREGLVVDGGDEVEAAG